MGSKEMHYRALAHYAREKTPNQMLRIQREPLYSTPHASQPRGHRMLLSIATYLHYVGYYSYPTA